MEVLELISEWPYFLLLTVLSNNLFCDLIFNDNKKTLSDPVYLRGTGIPEMLGGTVMRFQGEKCLSSHPGQLRVSQYPPGFLFTLIGIISFVV